eukprot:CAMPEP_0178722568 /NCGR_PEP_ID=MMETSP0699-20121125/25042_1 /TAXON_ID=265572 /ORGANISM="Extubocellulus spinifer, Strain CCMP396" /LENGTH=40 /DNA_ID= /DNA_START= /DNA_END= /DNA_ORIENTATION=
MIAIAMILLVSVPARQGDQIAPDDAAQIINRQSREVSLIL